MKVRNALNIFQLLAPSEDQLRQITDMINLAYFHGEMGMWLNDTKRTNINELIEFTQQGEIFAAAIEEKIVGAIRLTTLDDKTAEFGLLATHRDHLKHGIGSALIQAIEQQAQHQLGCTYMQLEILDPTHSTHPEKEFLKRWYTKLSYEFKEFGSITKAYPHLAPLLKSECNYLIYCKNLETASHPTT